MRDALIIANPASGRRRACRRRELAAAQQILRNTGIAAELLWTDGAGRATEMARRAATAGRGMVIVCGGDGTINEVVNGLAGSQVPLAVLPGGTANVLAKELSIPWDIPRAAKLIAQAAPRRIALGQAVPLGAPDEAAPRWFLCVAGAGPDGVMVYSVAAAIKLRLGILAYWLEGVRQFMRYRFPLFRVRAPELDREVDASMVIVGRTASYGGPFRITTRASLCDDLFEVCLVTTRARLRYLRYLPAIWSGRLRRERGVYFARLRSLRCEPLDEPRIYAQVDGEPCGRLPVEFRIVPEMLTLLAPRQSDG